MRQYKNLVKRNCLVFLRDRSAVFFSLLSMLIVLMLMGVFLGDMNVESVTSLLKQYGGSRDAAADRDHAVQLVQYWTLAGLMVVNAVTVTLTVIGVMVEDAAENRLAAFYAAPVKKSVIAFSYITAAALIGTTFCILTLGASLAFIAATGGTMLSAHALLYMVLYTLMNACIFSIIMYLAALFVKSAGAWSGIATIVGTLVGFVGAIYLPMGELPGGVAKVLKYLPILHGTSLMRKVSCGEALARTFKGLPEEVVTQYKSYMGITIEAGGKLIGSKMQILFICICGMLAAAIGIMAGRRKISDR